ncbi:putative leucine-rich repeat extensin-like protein 3 [Iris pallida]|uniref:Leucine-rich repeat extensin-like protein 3 n=1 Tax=Iris pallida TaxID=29817 RepID=A0AAX6FY15_IRIPA|nr:putative leucine-rich repeat extensin-like protein 3 [Iris pallida]
MASAPGGEAAADPFGFIDRECGPISSFLEERLFRLSPFLNDNPSLPPLSPLPPADAPILICSLPDDEQSPPAPPPQETNNNKGGESLSSKQQTPATTSTKTKKKRRRLMGAQLRISSSDADDQEEPTQPPPQPPEVPPPPPPPPPAPVTTTTRKLPESILKPNADRLDVSGQHSKEEAADVAPCDLVVTLADVVGKYSRQPDTTYDHMSLLEIAKMRGFFDRPSS